MAFWSQNFAVKDAGLKDPKRQFRFIVEFTGINAPEGGGAMWYAKSVAKPSFQINAAEHKYLNHTFWYPGSVTWQDVTLTLVDPVKPDMTATFADIIQAGGYSPPADANAYRTMSKASAAAALGTVFIIQFDAAGTEIEKWTLWNSFISDMKFGDTLQYGEDNLVELSVTLKYDWARLQTPGTDGSARAGSDNPKEFFGLTSS
jgi:hypothetical protein